MLLRAIALDYDGTIADSGIIHPEIRLAIEEARFKGLFVVIVTGRILQELRRVAGDLSFVDGVVAENGGVILLANGHRRLLGPPPFPELLNELSIRNIEFVVGRCLVDLDAENGQTVLEIIRELKLPLTISYNRNRMMILPQSISKSTGFEEMLNILGTSPHNAIGVGDGENDYELLSCCGYGVAVEWASTFLKKHADHVHPGEGLQAVADLIRQMASKTRIPVGSARHQKLVLESKKGQQSLEIVIRGGNFLIAGDSKSGKSWIAGLFCEQMILQHYTLVIIDPEGDYSSLTTLPNTLILGSDNKLPSVENLTSLYFHQGLSLVLNLCHLDFESKILYVKELLPLTAKFRQRRGYPHFILLDECHYFLDDIGEETILNPVLGSYILVTYRPSKLPQNVLSSLEAIVATRMIEQEEIRVVRETANTYSSTDWYRLLTNLQITEAVLLPLAEEGCGPRRFIVAPRLTGHVRHQTKYFEHSLRSDQLFVYTDEGQPTGESSNTLSGLVQSMKRVGHEVLLGHMCRHDFSRWILNVFDDPELAARVLSLEEKYVQDENTKLFTEKVNAAVYERYNHAHGFDEARSS